MLGIVFFLLIVMGVSFFLIHCGIKWIYSISLSMSSIAIIMYIAGLFGFLGFSVILVVITSIISFSYIIFARIKIKKTEAIKTDEYAYVSLTIIVIGAFSTIISYGNVMWAGDDLYHWGVVVKNMYQFNTFSLETPITITFTNYSEYTAILPYLATRLNGKFVDWILFAVMNIYCVSMLVPLLEGDKYKYSVIRQILLVPLILLLPLTWHFRYNTYNCLQVDRLLGLQVGFSLILSFRRNEDNKGNLFELTISLIAMSLVKEAGIYLSAFVLIFYLLERGKSVLNPKLMISSISIIVAAFSWRIYFIVKEATTFLTRKWSTVDDVMSFVAGNGRKEQIEAWNAALIKLIRGRGQRIGDIHAAGIWMIFLVCCLAILYFIYGKKWYKAISTCFYFSLCFVIWWLGCMYVILFQHAEVEMKVLSSYERYVDTFVIGIYVFVLYLLNGIKRGHVLAYSIVAILSGRMIGYNLWYCFYQKQYTNDSMVRISQLCSDVSFEDLDPGKDKIYIISQNDEGALADDYYYARYYINPIQSNLQLAYNIPSDYHLSFCLGEPYNEDDKSTTNYTINELEETLEEYNYLLILTQSNSFSEKYGDMFFEDEGAGLYYIVEQGNGHLKFQKVK